MSMDRVRDEIEENLVAKKDRPVVKRLAIRTAVLLALCIVGFLVLDLLQMIGRERISDINQRVPEIMLIVRAASIMVWVELCLLWTRVVLQPQLDVQVAARAAEKDAMAAAVVYATYTLQWLVRIFIFLKLCELV